MDSRSAQAVATCRFCMKHSRQKTGRPCVGLKGTVVSLPQCEHLVRVSTRLKLCPGDGDPRTETLLALQVLQRLGSFLNCLSWKNNCSPAVKTKSASQSMHFNILSWNSIERWLLQPIACTSARRTNWRTRRRKLAVPPQLTLETISLDSARHTQNGHGYSSLQHTKFYREKNKGPPPGRSGPVVRLILLFSSFFPAAFSRESFLHALLLAGFQVKGVALDLL